jgi:hypothetical protein
MYSPIRSILIESSHLHLGLPSELSGFPTKILYVELFLISPMRATCPVHLLLLDYFINGYIKLIVYTTNISTNTTQQVMETIKIILLIFGKGKNLWVPLYAVISGFLMLPPFICTSFLFLCGCRQNVGLRESREHFLERLKFKSKSPIQNLIEILWDGPEIKYKDEEAQIPYEFIVFIVFLWGGTYAPVRSLLQVP